MAHMPVKDKKMACRDTISTRCQAFNMDFFFSQVSKSHITASYTLIYGIFVRFQNDTVDIRLKMKQ